MEPQLIDYYNEMPSGINVIDKMNEELAVLQKKYDELEKKVKELNDKIWDYKYNVIFDFFFNHGLDIEKQNELKEEIYSDDDDIYFCKGCNKYTYEEWTMFPLTKYELYRSCKEEEEPYCNCCFDNAFIKKDMTQRCSRWGISPPPGKIKINYLFLRELTYLQLIKKELKKCENLDEKCKKMEEFSNKYFDIIVPRPQNKGIIEEYIYEKYIYKDTYYEDSDEGSDECSSESSYEGLVE
tara:strand:+ start:78 stop:794 length:717 start_codon:yes stop_codon:yes gene_type:complete